ncbi:MAG TPA: toll/interleukin-1 receptor domain-containing protein [Candidatus Elarobacter sp.]|jgi:hypothetical protein
MSSAIRALTAAVLRFGRLSLLYLVGLAVLAAIPVWPALDRRAAAGLLRAHQAQLDPNLVPVDLRLPDGADSAAALLGFLEPLRHARHDASPRAIVVDMFFRTDKLHADRAVLAKVGDAIGALTERNVKIYLAVNPYRDGTSGEVQNGFMDRLPAALYGRASGVGHTEWSVLSNEPGAAMLGYRAAIAERTVPAASYIYAMPLLLTGDLTEPADRQFPFVLGDPAGFRRAVRTLDDVRRDPQLLGDRIVLVGSTGPLDVAYGISGMESVAWALTERLTAATNMHVTLFANQAVELGCTLLLALFAAAVFAVVFQLLRPRRFTIAAAAAVAIALPAALLMLALHVLAAQHVIYLQATFEVAGIVLASAVCAWAGREQLRRDRLISSYVDGRKIVERRYDVFVSYSRDDENAAWVEEHVVKPLAAARNSEGKPLSIFFDKQTIRQGIRWYESIVDALWGSDIMIPVYTKRYFERPMCTEELLTAMRRAVDDRRFAIRPLSRVAADIPRRFGGTQYVDVMQDPDFMEHLLAAVVARTDAP